MTATLWKKGKINLKILECFVFLDGYNEKALDT